MDDYLKSLLKKQGITGEENPEKLTRLLEEPPAAPEAKLSPGDGGGEQGETQLAAALEETSADMAADVKTEPRSENFGRWGLSQGDAASVLERMADGSFLAELEREIACLDYVYADRAAIQVETGGLGETASTAGAARVTEIVKNGELLTPEALSRVYERDARRYR